LADVEKASSIRPSSTTANASLPKSPHSKRKLRPTVFA
jgi:hypothetical protein